MSLIDNIRGKPGNKPASLNAPEIEMRLQTATAALEQLERTHGDAALDAINGEAGAESRLEDLKATIRLAREKIATLESAVTAAKARDEAELTRAREAVRKTQKAAQRKHLDALEVAMASMSKSLEDAVRQYHIALDKAEQAMASTPIGSIFPDGACTPGEIQRRVKSELFRLSAPDDPIDGDQMRIFPGGACDFDFIGQPRAIEPMVQVIRRGVKLVLASSEKAAE
jgi:hypothetical protein